MSNDRLLLVSHHLCPYVQRAAIVLAEKGIPFERHNIDLAHKPDWFIQISPLGKTPVLVVGETALFESAPIVEYLDEIRGPTMHPADPLEKAENRAWMEVGSTILNDIAQAYGSTTQDGLNAAIERMRLKFQRVEGRLNDRDGPYFNGSAFSIVDAVYAPVFRYFNVFDELDAVDALGGLEKLAAWRNALARRASVRQAAPADYNDRLRDFLRNKASIIGQLAVVRQHPGDAAA
jgi:glutathione S-transferase